MGIGVAALSIVIGCAIAAFAGGAYSTNFSTILRVAYNLRLSDDLDIADTSGKGPLPKRLEKTIVSLPPDGVFAIYTDPGQYIGPSDGQVTEIIVHGKPGTSTASEEQVSSHSAQPAPAYDPPMDNMGQTGHGHHQTQ